MENPGDLQKDWEAKLAAHGLGVGQLDLEGRYSDTSTVPLERSHSAEDAELNQVVTQEFLDRKFSKRVLGAYFNLSKKDQEAALEQISKGRRAGQNTDQLVDYASKLFQALSEMKKLKPRQWSKDREVKRLAPEDKQLQLELKKNNKSGQIRLMIEIIENGMKQGQSPEDLAKYVM